MPAISSFSFLSWALFFCFLYPVMQSVLCALCHGEYQHLTQLMQSFVLTGFSRCSHTSWGLCFLCCLLGLWVELRDRSPQTGALCLAGAANTYCHFPFMKVIKGTGCYVHRLRIWAGKIICLQNYHFHAWFPGDEIQLQWQANLSETTGAWF